MGVSDKELVRLSKSLYIFTNNPFIHRLSDDNFYFILLLPVSAVYQV